MADELDVDQTLRTLARALTLQAETILTMTHLAGSLRGLDGAAVKPQLRSFVQAELEDAYLLLEKFSALGGELRMELPPIDVPGETAAALEHLMALERRAIAALHAVIPHTGQEPRSEALEHRLEHLIMRKQQQLDYLWHASGRAEPLDDDSDENRTGTGGEPQAS